MANFHLIQIIYRGLDLLVWIKRSVLVTMKNMRVSFHSPSP